MSNRNQIDGIERRNYGVKFEIRAVGGDDGMPQIVGHSAVFDVLSEMMWGFREKIAPGAFAETIKEDDIRALFNHDSNYVLGRNLSETLSLKEDDTGLWIEVDPPDTNYARNLIQSIERGDITGMSFAFRTITDSWNIVEDEDIRTLEKLKLYDVGPVTFPAYPETDAAVRSYEKAQKSGLLTRSTPRLNRARRDLELESVLM